MELFMAPGRILLEKVKEDEFKTEKGIILLRGTKTSLIEAVVTKTGNGIADRKMEVKVGDRVYFKKGSELDVEIHGEEFWLIDWNSYLMFER